MNRGKGFLIDLGKGASNETEFITYQVYGGKILVGWEGGGIEKGGEEKVEEEKKYAPFELGHKKNLESRPIIP